MLLADQVVIVSGVGPGLGRALALRCAEQGAKVVLVARSRRPARRGRRGSSIAARGGTAVPIPGGCELAGASRSVLVSVSLSHVSAAIDGLVNNAAVIPPLAPVVRCRRRGWWAHRHQRNFATAYHLTRAVLPPCVCAPRIVVEVCVRDIRDPKPGSGPTTWRSTRSWASPARSRRARARRHPRQHAGAGQIVGERLRSYFAERAPIPGRRCRLRSASVTWRASPGRLPDPDEYADAAVFLLPTSRCVTGHVPDVNGGEYFD